MAGAVDLVVWRGDSYAFKTTEELWEGLLRELDILNRLSHSPHIIELSAIVVNGTSELRGFLTPFMDGGDLEHQYEEPSNPSLPNFPWQRKSFWALQIAEGVADLHAIEAYNGDLKLSNIVLNERNEAVLIDFLPMGFSDEYAAPEVRIRSHDPTAPVNWQDMLSGPADIYSLGLVLWAVAEEKCRIVQPLEWREGFAPLWYQQMVHRCLGTPESRPPATEIVALLEKRGD